MSTLAAQQGSTTAYARCANQQADQHVDIHLTIDGAREAQWAFRKRRVAPLLPEPVEVSWLAPPVAGWIKQTISTGEPLRRAYTQKPVRRQRTEIRLEIAFQPLVLYPR